MDSTSNIEKDLKTDEDVQFENDAERERIYDNIVHSFPIRQNLVDTAANFLRAPHVMNSKNEDKQNFLSKKGLSNHEIQAAFNAAGLSYENAPGLPLSAEPATAHQYQVIPSAHYQPLTHHYPGVAPVVPTFWTRVRDVCNLAFFLFGTVNAVRYIYRHYIRPWLTGQPPMVPVDMQLLQLQSAVADSLIQLRAAVEAMQKTVAAYTSAMQNSSDSRTLTDVKAELTSLKSLLLSKRSFAPTPTPFALGIPSWQKSCTTNDVTKDVSSEAANGGTDVENNGVTSDVSMGTTAVLDTDSKVSNIISSDNNKTPDIACDDRNNDNGNSAEVASPEKTKALVESDCGPRAEAGDQEGSVSSAPCSATAASDGASVVAAAAGYISGNNLPATALRDTLTTNHHSSNVSGAIGGRATSVVTGARHRDALIAEAIAGDDGCSAEAESASSCGAGAGESRAATEGVFGNSTTLPLCNGAVKCSEHEDSVTC